VWLLFTDEAELDHIFSIFTSVLAEDFFKVCVRKKVYIKKLRLRIQYPKLLDVSPTSGATAI